MRINISHRTDTIDILFMVDKCYGPGFHHPFPSQQRRDKMVLQYVHRKSFESDFRVADTFFYGLRCRNELRSHKKRCQKRQRARQFCRYALSVSTSSCHQDCICRNHYIRLHNALSDGCTPRNTVERHRPLIPEQFLTDYYTLYNVRYHCLLHHIWDGFRYNTQLQRYI